MLIRNDDFREKSAKFWLHRTATVLHPKGEKQAGIARSGRFIGLVETNRRETCSGDGTIASETGKVREGQGFE